MKIDFSTSSVILRVAVDVADFAALPSMSLPVEDLLLELEPVILPQTDLPTLLPRLRATLLMTAPQSVPRMVRFQPLFEAFSASFCAFSASRCAFSASF